MLKNKLLSAFTLQTAYKKGFRNGSKFWQFSFIVVLIFKILKWLFKRPNPQKIDEYELSPGEYKVVVNEKK
ncbi:MAG: hypothetical protein U0R17_00430 [Acidimicrobiia bacterium]